jgi:SAM-dependent methyltransferase
VNRLHYWYCSREAWKRHVREDLVPVALDDLELGEHALEVGPGFGPATEVLAQRAPNLTALEIDPVLAGALRDRLGDRVEVVDGDGTAMPFDDASFSSAACFTMLHHVPSPQTQDRLFAEVRRVLRPGAAFAGTDSIGRGLGFALLHIGDTKVVIDPSGLAERLVAAGFEDAVVHAGRDAFRFRAYAGSGNASSPAATASESRFSGGGSGQAQREL